MGSRMQVVVLDLETILRKTFSGIGSKEDISRFGHSRTDMDGSDKSPITLQMAEILSRKKSEKLFAKSTSELYSGSGFVRCLSQRVFINANSFLVLPRASETRFDRCLVRLAFSALT